jgi:hypothetical protein
VLSWRWNLIVCWWYSRLQRDNPWRKGRWAVERGLKKPGAGGLYGEWAFIKFYSLFWRGAVRAAALWGPKAGCTVLKKII